MEFLWDSRPRLSSVRDRRMETYPGSSDCSTDRQSVLVNLDLRVAQAAQAARSHRGATPAAGKGLVKWLAGLLTLAIFSGRGSR